MKTVFLSLPMKGRTNESIRETINSMIRVITAMYPSDEISFIDNFRYSHNFSNEEEDEAKNKSLLYLGDAIQKMAHCDYIAMISSEILWRGEVAYNGCAVEQDVAQRYGLKAIVLSDATGEIFLPDLKVKYDEYRKKHLESTECCGTVNK